ncbi:MAG: DNA primase [Isosphaeraceae bacterium]
MPLHSETTLSAIKNAVDIVALVGEYVSLRRAGSKYKALCPFHDDHNPSLEVNPERQSFKCWSCGVGGDIFDFVKNREHVDFPEALRMLADRAGITLERPSNAAPGRGPSKVDLLAINAWAERVFAEALPLSAEATEYLDRRGLSMESVRRFRLGFAPAGRGWLVSAARREQLSIDLLEQVGLVSRSERSAGDLVERFRGRLMFPIHDDRGRNVGFGARILPEVERSLAAEGKHVAKYINSPETSLFHKRMILYAADMARTASHESGWVAVVEGYTDVIAAHQLGVTNVVGTLGTALGEDHLRALRRLAQRVVLVFDGDDAGQSAADRALELFLGSDLDLRVLTLPANLDPCDFLLTEGADAFRKLADAALDPLSYLLGRASARFDLDSTEGSRRAAEWVLGFVNRVPKTHRLGVEVSQARVLDILSRRLRVPLEVLNRLRRQLQQPTAAGPREGRRGASAAGSAASVDAASTSAAAPGSGGSPPAIPVRQGDLDRTDLELIRVALNEPAAVPWLATRLAAATLKDAPLRAILQVCYELQSEGQPPSYERIMTRLEDPVLRGLAAGLIADSALTTPEPQPLPDGVSPAAWQERLEKMLMRLAERQRQARQRELKKALDETDQHADPDAYRAIKLEYQRLLTSGPKP